jgi:hypothetical protein
MARGEYFFAYGVMDGTFMIESMFNLLTMGEV